MIESFSVKMFDDKYGGGKIYIKKEYYDILKSMLGFPDKKDMKAVIDKEKGTLCIMKL